jgi:hypothetical protein
MGLHPAFAATVAARRGGADREWARRPARGSRYRLSEGWAWGLAPRERRPLTGLPEWFEAWLDEPVYSSKSRSKASSKLGSHSPGLAIARPNSSVTCVSYVAGGGRRGS